MGLVVEVQRPCLVHLLQLLPVPEVQGEVGGDDGFADDLQHLLVLAGAQGGEDVVPFQLLRDQRTPVAPAPGFQGIASYSQRCGHRCRVLP